jgi:hypothetical protein
LRNKRFGGNVSLVVGSNLFWLILDKWFKLRLKQNRFSNISSKNDKKCLFGTLR